MINKMKGTAVLLALLVQGFVSVIAYEGHHDNGNAHHEGYDGNNNAHYEGYDDSDSDSVGDITPPSPFDKAAFARWLAHNTGWGSLSTIQASTRERPGTPFGNIASYSDGPPSKSTGKIYFLHSPLDSSMIDIMENNSTSFAISEMQTGYCQGKKIDAEDPRCARLSLSGPLIQVTDPDEIEVAKDAMFSRHPAMKNWYHPSANGEVSHEDSHHFGFWRLELKEIWLINFFGGAAHVSIDAWDRGTDEEGKSSLPLSFSVMKVNKSGGSSRFDIFFITLVGTFALGALIGRYTTTVSQRGFKKLEGTIDTEEGGEDGRKSIS